MRKTARIGIDVGGTFTDFVLHDASRGITHTGKRLTTPESPSRAIVDGLMRLLLESDTPITRVRGIVHGTTLATNTLIERTGPCIGLITTEGFRDVLAMGAEIRYDVEDLHGRRAPVLVSRRRRIGVAGRITADGAENTPLEEQAVLGAIRDLVDEHGVKAVAVAFLHSYANPDHELRAREVIRDAYPDLLVSLSAEVAPLSGEYERTTTACVNAYLQPVMHAHLTELQAELAELGFDGQLHIMLSSGGLTTVDHARAFPVKLLESGPAAGAIAAAFIARRAHERRVIAFDMGGTTAKMCVIDDGQPARAHTFEAGRVETFKPGSGLPLRLTVVELIEIGSGGGSIAAVDDLGLLTVGPRSAGAAPGPVAYGRGGLEPTVTDSDLLLGYLDPHTFLGGEMPLAVEDVAAVVERRLAQPLGLEMETAAIGVQDIVAESMAGATRAHLAEKGRDPRVYALMAFGGAGPVHAYALAKRLKIQRVIVPMGAGVVSALGFLVAAPSFDAATSYVAPLEAVEWERAAALLHAMELEACSLVAAAAGGDVSISIRRSVDMRYVGQGYEIEVALPAGELNASLESAIRTAFSKAYLSTFGRTVDEAAPELVNWRSSATGPEVEIDLAYSAVRQQQNQLGSRRVHFLDFGELETPVYDRYALERGTVIRGPAVFHEVHTSCSFGPDCVITVDANLNLVAEIG